DDGRSQEQCADPRRDAELPTPPRRDQEKRQRRQEAGLLRTVVRLEEVCQHGVSECGSAQHRDDENPKTRERHESGIRPRGLREGRSSERTRQREQKHSRTAEELGRVILDSKADRRQYEREEGGGVNESRERVLAGKHRETANAVLRANNQERND